MEHQNWEPQVLRKSAAQIKASAIRTGRVEAVERKTTSTQGSHFAKVEREDYVKPKLLAPESKQELIQRRLAEKLTQQQLDQRCSFPPHTIRDLEANKRAPTPKELQVLNRVLKCGLKLV
jgi:ribosome-binding protein aMBF1 (putative translation factor)